MPANTHFQRPARQVAAMCVGLLAFCVALTAQASDDLDSRRAEIARMQPTEQQELLRKQERFAALPAAEQERLRAMRAALDEDPDSARLHQVLVRYHEWLKTLTASQRAELADLAPADRIEQIKKLQRQQHAAQEHHHRAELLSHQDMFAVMRWAEDVAWKNRAGLLEDVPKAQRAKLEKSDSQWQRHAVLFKAYERARHGGGSALTKVTQEDIDKLSAKLSEPAKKELTDAADLAARRKLVGSWIGMAMHRGPFGVQSRKMGPLVGEDLMQFLENEVPAAERERLLKLPREQMMEELRGMYFARARESGPSGMGPPWGDGKAFERAKGRFGNKSGRPSARSNPGDAKPPASETDATKPEASPPADKKTP